MSMPGNTRTKTFYKLFILWLNKTYKLASCFWMNAIAVHIFYTVKNQQAGNSANQIPYSILTS